MLSLWTPCDKLRGIVRQKRKQLAELNRHHKENLAEAERIRQVSVWPLDSRIEEQRKVLQAEQHAALEEAHDIDSDDSDISVGTVVAAVTRHRFAASAERVLSILEVQRSGFEQEITSLRDALRGEKEDLKAEIRRMESGELMVKKWAAHKGAAHLEAEENRDRLQHLTREQKRYEQALGLAEKRVAMHQVQAGEKESAARATAWELRQYMEFLWWRGGLTIAGWVLIYLLFVDQVFALTRVHSLTLFVLLVPPLWTFSSLFLDARRLRQLRSERNAAGHDWQSVQEQTQMANNQILRAQLQLAAIRKETAHIVGEAMRIRDEIVANCWERLSTQRQEQVAKESEAAKELGLGNTSWQRLMEICKEQD